MSCPSSLSPLPSSLHPILPLLPSHSPSFLPPSYPPSPFLSLSLLPPSTLSSLSFPLTLPPSSLHPILPLLPSYSPSFLPPLYPPSPSPSLPLPPSSAPLPPNPPPPCPVLGCWSGGPAAVRGRCGPRLLLHFSGEHANCVGQPVGWTHSHSASGTGDGNPLHDCLYTFQPPLPSSPLPSPPLPSGVLSSIWQHSDC